MTCAPPTGTSVYGEEKVQAEVVAQLKARGVDERPLDEVVALVSAALDFEASTFASTSGWCHADRKRGSRH